MKIFKYVMYLFLLSVSFASYPSWGNEPEAIDIYHQLLPLFTSENVEEILNSWGKPAFEEHGALFWQWGDGQLCCISNKGRVEIASYLETSDSSQMEAKMLKRYVHLKEQFMSILGPEDAESEGEIKAQRVKTITSLWEKESFQVGWMCFFNERMQNTTLQFLIRR